MKKKRFLKKAFITLTLVAALLGYYAWQIETHWVKFEQLKLPIKNLPSNLEGKTLVQISDIHIGDYVSKDFIKNNFAKVGITHPDIIVYTGDFVRLVDNALPLHDLDEVMQLAPKGKLQTLAILGNHDYGRAFKDSTAADSITTLLKKYHITVLRNESVNINGLQLYGMDDYWGTNFDPVKTMQNYNRNQASLVLCHNPDVADLDVWNG
ncbi:MAG: metallophosphoesterase, partial [Sphingobacterium sp.]